MKSFESHFRPAIGDIIEDPGFDSRFHNSYEVVKVSINYSLNECLVSLAPLFIEQENMSAEDYIEKLKNNGWKDYSIH
jgi:hypothetical protein